jgi:hypothetical protein
VRVILGGRTGLEVLLLVMRRAMRPTVPVVTRRGAMLCVCCEIA